MAGLPVVVKGLMRRKMSPKIALFGHKLPKDDLKDVKRIFDKVGVSRQSELAALLTRLVLR